jgi:NADPH-dependent 2,4-dienoyl-CoA reductase/sulfur reductase-like enzyme
MTSRDRDGAKARLSRRQFTCGSGGLGVATVTIGFPVPLRGQLRPRVVVIGGGAGGATCARYLAKDSGGALAVTLVEHQQRYTTCFYSNLYLAGWRDLKSLSYGYGGLQSVGVQLITTQAAAMDPAAKTVRLETGETLAYDKLVVAPGIDMRYDSIAGYSEGAAEIMPHSWKAGAQTALLRSQLEAMPDGGLFVIVVPPEPYRCPPAPYERACMVACYLTQAKPRSKILILDAKDSFTKQPLFEEAWRTRYKGLVEWVPGALGGRAIAVDAAAMTITTSTGDIHRADVANVVPAQAAGSIAHRAGLVDGSGWCPIVPASMVSRAQPDIHVLGDAAIASAMPKSAFAANSQAKVAAMVIRSELTGSRAFPARYRNTCWSSLAADDAVKIGASYVPGDDRIESVDSFASKVGESREVRRQTRAEADAWYDSITADIFG